jgi:hypothetical protein
MIYQTTVEGARLDVPSDPAVCPEPLQRLITSCWANQPKDRPTAIDVHEALEGIACGLSGSSCPALLAVAADADADAAS